MSTTEILLNGISANELKTDILNGIDKLIKDHFKQQREQAKYLSRQEIAKMLSIDLSTVHNWTKKGILTAHQIGGRVFYLRSEVENAIVELKN
jgi:excisionase family DNA binding protein